MVQNYEIIDGIEKLDGYNVKHVKELRGSKCKFCKKPRGLTACYVSKCKSFYHLPCGILNGSVQVKEELTSYCPRHSQEAIRDKGWLISESIDNSVRFSNRDRSLTMLTRRGRQVVLSTIYRDCTL